MNEHYAVDPEAPANTRDLKVLLDQFGLQTGRFLSRYPGNWEQLLMHSLRDLSELERKKARELLLRRRTCLLPAGPVPYQITTTWAGNAAVAKDRGAFDGVIGQPSNGYGWPDLEEVLYDIDGSLPDGRGEHIQMLASQYAKCARPLLAFSAEVILVDRYFTLRDKAGERCSKRWPVMQALLKAAHDSEKCQSLRLVLDRARIVATEGDEDTLKKDIRAAVDGAGSWRVNVEYEIRDSLHHGRYLFSICGGLQFDRGFEVDKTSKNHVHWLSEPELKDPVTWYAPPTRLNSR